MDFTLALLVTVIICPGPLVHRMGKMSWRNDHGEEGPVFANLCPATSTIIKGKHSVLVNPLHNIMTSAFVMSVLTYISYITNLDPCEK